MPLAESVGELARLKDEGKIRWVGLSNVSVAQIREAQAIVPITTVQNRLNPFFREALTGGVVRYCAEQGIGFLAYSPTGGGRLTASCRRIRCWRTSRAARRARPTRWCWLGRWPSPRP